MLLLLLLLRLQNKQHCCLIHQRKSNKKSLRSYTICCNLVKQKRLQHHSAGGVILSEISLFLFSIIIIICCCCCCDVVLALPSTNNSKKATMGRTEAMYMPYRKHAALFKGVFEEAWLHPDMKQLRDLFTKNSISNADKTKEAIQQNLLRLETNEVYSFECLSKSFLKMFNEEIANFYKASETYNIPVRRPNSMNNYGVVVNEIGMQPMLSSFQQEYLWPIALVLFPKHASQFDDHHSFLVRYQADEDLGLDMHVDDSDVTFNVCLGHEFTGATLTFCGNFAASNHRKKSHQYTHQVGRAVLHLGSRRHGADDIDTGVRSNLIVWNHNFHYRYSLEYRERRLPGNYEREEGPPDLECLSYTHDRDYAAYKSLPSHLKQGQYELKGWCPPRGKEYDQFPEL